MAIKNNLGIWGQSNDYLDTGFEKDDNTGALKGFEPGSLIYAQDVNTALRNASLMGYVIGEILESKSQSGEPLEKFTFDINYTNDNNLNENLIDNIEAALEQLIYDTGSIFAESTYNCFKNSDKYPVKTLTENKQLLKFIKDSNSDNYYLDYDNEGLGTAKLPLWYSGTEGFTPMYVVGSSPTRPVFFNSTGDVKGHGFAPIGINGSNNKKPVYFDMPDGFKAMDATIGSSKLPLYYDSSNGFDTIDITDSNNKKPVYFDSNEGFKIMDATIGSNIKPIYYDKSTGFTQLSLIDTNFIRIGDYSYGDDSEHGQLTCYLNSQIEFTSINVPTSSTPIYAYWKKAKEAFKLTTKDDDSGYSVGNIAGLGDKGFIKPIGFKNGIPIEAKQFYIDEDSYCIINKTPVSNPPAGSTGTSVEGTFSLRKDYNFLTKKFRLLLLIGSNSARDLNAQIVPSEIINLDWCGLIINGYKIGNVVETCKVSFPIGSYLNNYNASLDTFGLVAYVSFGTVAELLNSSCYIQLFTQRRVASQSSVKEYYLNTEQAELIKGLVIEYIN